MKGQGGRLLEPEEMDRLEKAGYNTAGKPASVEKDEASMVQGTREVAPQLHSTGEIDLDEEARRFEEELAEMAGDGEAGMQRRRAVEMVEIEDDGT